MAESEQTGRSQFRVMRSLLAPQQPGVPATASATAGGSTEPSIPAWKSLAEFLGLAAGVTGWISAIGIASRWAWLHGARIPTLPTLAQMDPQWFLVDGFRMLGVPLILGLVASLAYYYVWPRGTIRARRRSTLATLTIVALAISLWLARFSLIPILLALALLATVLIWLQTQPDHRRVHVGFGAVALVILIGSVWTGILYVLAVLLTTAVIAILGVFAAASSGFARGRNSLIIFTAIAVWSGILGLERLAFTDSRAMYPATVYLKDNLTPVEGFYLHSSGDSVVVAAPLTDDAKTVYSIPRDLVIRLDYGTGVSIRARAVPDGRERPLPGEPTPVLVATPPPTPSRQPPSSPSEPPSAGDRPSQSSIPGFTLTPVPAPTATIDQNPFVLNGVSLTRREGELVELDLALTNLGDGDIKIDGFADKSRTGLGSISVLAPSTGKVYDVATKVGNSCLGPPCDEALVLQPRQTSYIKAAFMIPDGVDQVDLNLPYFSWIRDVGIG